MSDRFGEVKAKKNIYPKEAKKYADSGKVGIMLVQSKPSPKTKRILRDANITLYEGLEPSEVEEKIKELEEKIKENRIKESE